MYQVCLTLWRTSCPAWRWPPPGPPGSAQPSPTARPWISRIWPSARSSAPRYKLSVPAQGCASSHRRSATLTSSATHPQYLIHGTFRPLVPRDLRRQIFEHFHGTAHPGRRATRRLISSRYVWKGLSTDVTAWAKACLGCQRAKGPPPCNGTSSTHPGTHPPFSHIHVDLVGPLLASKGFTYLFTIIDRTSRWPEAITFAATTTVDCANALFQGWVSRFGVPAVRTSDRGAQFTSSLWAALCSLLNIQHNQTTAYHPQSNGMVEHFHRGLKDALRAR